MRILNSKYFYLILIVLTSIYVIFFTKIIKYESKITKSIIEGLVIRESIDEDKVNLTIKCENEKIIATIYLQDESYESLLGKTIRFEGKEKELYNNTIPNTFNYKKYLYNNKIYKSFTISKYEIIKDENIFYRFKNKIIKRISEYDDTTKSYLNLFILGDKTYLSESEYSNYRENGVWHLFAISGMHINLIVLVLSKLLKRFKFKDIVIILFLSFFAFLTSFSPSVMRATIFFIIHKILVFFNLSISSFKELLLTGILLIIYNPFIIYNAGFQYSFIITGAIMLKSKNITGNYFSKILKISILSIMVSIPITVNMNYEINLFSIFLNVLFAPFVSMIIFPLNILTFMFKFLEPLNNIVIYILEFLNNLGAILKIVIVIPKIPILIIIIYYIFILLYLTKSKKKLIIGNLFLIIITIIYPKLDNNYYVYYLDVSQGDSSVIISPHQKEILMIDTGGSINSDYHVSNNTVLFLKSLGIKKIDLLIISHGDADHGKETLNLLENYQVDNIILNKNSYNKLEKDIIKNGHVVDSYKLKYINYTNYNDYLSSNENYSSILTYVNILNYKFLYMGDAPKEVEEKFIKNNYLKVDFLKVGHHGSNTSSSKYFIKKLNPDYSIISVGRNNMYGHPNDEVLDALSNTLIYRTDRDGSIEIKINNNGYRIRTCPS